MGLFLRTAAVNALMLLGAVAALALTPATVSDPVEVGELIVLAGGVAAVFAVNLALLRPSFARLESLAHMMRRVDLLQPEGRPSSEGNDEVAQLVQAFNEMLDRLERERRDSGRRALLAQEEERRRVGQELHDEIGQQLTALILTLDRAATAADPARVAEAREMARDALMEVRGLARRLRPDALNDLGLRSGLASLVARFGRATGLHIDAALPPELPPLAAEAELVVYRVAQEALTNVARHAGAGRVSVTLTGRGDRLRLVVADDGRGAPPDADGAGLRGMRERALLVGGELSIDARAWDATNSARRHDLAHGPHPPRRRSRGRPPPRASRSRRLRRW